MFLLLGLQASFRTLLFPMMKWKSSWDSFLENIPKGFLGVLDKKISVERQLTFRQALGNTQLELHIRIGSGRFMPDRRPADEIIIFE